MRFGIGLATTLPGADGDHAVKRRAIPKPFSSPLIRRPVEA
jgi:hypothetical protein